MLEPLDLEPREICEKRHKIAEAFFYQYIIPKMDVHSDHSDAIEAIEELIAYDGDLERITQMMALSIDS